MKTQYFTATSLDGFIADPDDSLDWLFPLGDPEDTSYPSFIRGVGAIAMGSTTYEWLLRHLGDPRVEMAAWPYTPPAWVFTSRTLSSPPGADVRFVRGDVLPVHKAMTDTAGDRNIWIVGGGDLAGQFYDRGLLDEIHVQVASVTLGRGKPLFPRKITAPPLQLMSVRAVGTGFAELVYKVPPSAEEYRAPRNHRAP